MRVLLLFVLCISTYASGMFDNRYFAPFINRKPSLCDCAVASSVDIRPFFMTANQSLNCYGDAGGLFDYTYGEEPYSLRFVDDAIVASGRRPKSMLRSDWRGIVSVGPYYMGGDMNAQGFGIQLYAPITCNLGVGFRGALMRVRSNMRLVRDFPLFEPIANEPGDAYELRETQNAMHQALGLEPAQWEHTGFSDSEIYLKLFRSHEYEYRCRYIEAGLSLGLVLPTGSRRDINNPASIPFGGDGHTGMFLEGTLDAVLKYDLRAGLICRYEQRFPSTQTRRAPVDREPERFGALVAPLRVRYGPTLALAPYATLENLREGLGIQVGYVLVKHGKDRWPESGNCAVSQSVAERLRMQSAWSTENLWCTVLYDLRESMHGWTCAPIFSISFDIPLDWTLSERSFQTFGVSLSMEVCF